MQPLRSLSCIVVFKHSPRAASLFLVTTYLLLSLPPFIPMLYGRIDADWPVTLIMETATWFGLWILFRQPSRFHWLLLPAFLATPAELYLDIFYHQGISVHHLALVAETTPQEAWEFLNGRVFIAIACLLLVLAWWYAAWRAARQATLLTIAQKWRWPLFDLLAVVLCVLIYGLAAGVQPAAKDQAASQSSTSDPELARVESIALGYRKQAGEAPKPAGVIDGLHLPKMPHWAAIPFDPSRFAATWPFGFFMRLYDFWREHAFMTYVTRGNRDFHFGATQGTAADQPQIAVLVIGESARYDRWNLNGYARDTNPLLKQEANVESFSNMITPYTATRLSVPLMLSSMPSTVKLKQRYSEKSVLSAFKEAGFKTFWISNQMSAGRFDTTISAFADEADVRRYLNMGSYINESNYDQVLLDPLHQAIADPSQKKLIVMHTLGNHWNYSLRHPQEFDRWHPSFFGVAQPDYSNLAHRSELSNSYDNSMLYTDWVLSRIIDQLKEGDRIASMIYLSDHGESLFEGSCTQGFHGHNNDHEFHIPMLVWYSERYASTFPGKVEQLKRHKDARLSTENIFHTLSDMSDLHYLGEKPDWSFANARLVPHTRYVDSYGWSDFDNSTRKGDCLEVVDKGTPLPQD
jgi:glucan phosphoethanolaminetransferase (alkaline phosphatase superfamily)